MAFTTAKGLARHKRLGHKEFSMEHNMVDGATCPHCLQYFWTSARLQQHLAYVSRKTGVNACYQALARQGFCASYSTAYRPKELVEINRADALQALGPLPEPRDWMRDEIDAGFVRPADCDLVGLWLSTLAALPPEDHEWAAWAFLVWGRAPLDELLQGLIDGEAEQIICDAFVELAEVFPLARANELRGQARARLAYLQDCQGRPIPHRPVRRGTANVKERIETALQVPRAYVDLAIWHDAIRAMRWTSNMISRAIP
ncbi:unnamed protein product, partial [Durusdinium trenchii]